MSTVKVTKALEPLQQEKYQEFLDALRERGSKQPIAPASKIPAIENSEHKQVIFNCLANNWSAERIHSYLLQTMQINIPTSAIQTYRDQLDEDVFLPISHLQHKFKELDIEVDAIGELARLLKLSQERLDMALFLESITHPLNTIVDQQKREYWELLKQYLAIQKGLGFFTKDTTSRDPQDVLPANITPGEIPTIRHLLELRVTSVELHRPKAIDADVKVLG